MKHLQTWAVALLCCTALSSCALSYPYCDAYNGVTMETAPESPAPETPVDSCTDVD